MRYYYRYYIQFVPYLFSVLLPVTIFIYFLRGLGFLGFMSGGPLLFLVFLTLITGILSGLDKTA
jgi:hypothetical protein